MPLGAPTLPPPEITPKVTVTPLTGLLNASVTCATIGLPRMVLGLPLCVLPESAVIADAGPADSVNAEPGALRVPSVKLSVPVVTRPNTLRPKKVATPLVKTTLLPATLAVPAKLATIVPAALVTVLPNASTTLTTGCATSDTPAPPVADGGVTYASALAAPGESVSGDVTVRVPSVKESVYAPIVPPTTSALSVPTPDVIVAVLPLTRLAPGAVAVIVPLAVVTRLPKASTTLTTGCAASATPAPPDTEGAVTNASAAGGPAFNINAVMTCRVPSEKVSVYAPTSPPTVRVLSEPTPAVIVTVPLLTTPPTLAVTVRVPVAVMTVLPDASTTLTTGCVPSATPAPAAAEGAVVKASALAGPATRVRGAVTVRVPSLKVSV